MRNVGENGLPSALCAATAATSLAVPREGFFEGCEISAAVNRAANDRPALLEPIAQSPTPARVHTRMPATLETQMSLPNA
jgi:hypothetical protein